MTRFIIAAIKVEITLLNSPLTLTIYPPTEAQGRFTSEAVEYEPHDTQLSEAREFIVEQTPADSPIQAAIARLKSADAYCANEGSSGDQIRLQVSMLVRPAARAACQVTVKLNHGTHPDEARPGRKIRKPAPVRGREILEGAQTSPPSVTRADRGEFS